MKLPVQLNMPYYNVFYGVNTETFRTRHMIPPSDRGYSRSGETSQSIPLTFNLVCLNLETTLDLYPD